MKNLYKVCFDRVNPVTGNTEVFVVFESTDFELAKNFLKEINSNETDPTALKEYYISSIDLEAQEPNK